MKIYPYELDIFQECRALWKLSKSNKRKTIFSPPISPYCQALFKTIVQMYTWLHERHTPISDKQVKDRWDKNWSNEEKKIIGTELESSFRKAHEGWIFLFNYWENIYLEEMKYVPIGVNFDFSHYIRDLHYKVHIDLLLVDNKGDFIIRQFGQRRSEWKLYSSLSSKLEIVAISQSLRKSPLMLQHIDLNSTKPSIHFINISNEYFSNAIKIIDDVSNSIRKNNIYGNININCPTCIHRSKCWF